MLLEYQLDQIKIVDFLLLAKFWACPDNYGPPSSKIIENPILTTWRYFFGWIDLKSS